MNIGWGIVAVAVVGHFALYLWIYNRLNATGLPRKRIKQIEAVFLAACLLIPPALLALYGDFLLQIYRGTARISAMPVFLAAYGAVCLAVVGLFAGPWLMSRPGLIRSRVDVVVRRRRLHVDREVSVPLALTRKCRWLASLPGNQILQLAIEEKELPVIGLPPQLDGLRVAHLSDAHLTGHIAPDYFRYAVQQANAWRPDMMVLSGDIVDVDRCIAWVGECFGAARAADGCFFVLGNHDKRVRQPADVRAAMASAGWCDLGGHWLQRRLRGHPVTLVGNERPWFPGPAEPPSEREPGMRIAVCHSPDQIDWARRCGVRLMLAGHTHGGQGRLPLIGPVLSPSRYGSRYASGQFHLPPTTMHVSRGLSGVHLLRIHCPPELALLILRCDRSAPRD